MQLIGKNALLMSLFLFSLVLLNTPAAAQDVGDVWSRVYYDPDLGGPFRSVADNESLFVAVGDNGMIFTSSSGKDNWTKRNAGTTENLYGIGFGNGLFVAVGYSGTVVTSPNGITWTKRNSNLTQGLWGAAYGDVNGGTYVVVGLYGDVATSPDGTTWTKRNLGVSKSFRAVCYGANQFIAVGNAGAVMSSADGITWTNHSVSAAYNLYAVDYMDALNMFVCGGADGVVYTSSNGTSWTKRNTGYSNYLWQVTYCDGNIWFAGNKASDDPSNIAACLKSPDGINWTRIYTGSNSHLRGISSIGSRLVAAGDRRTIMYSDNTPLPDLTIFTPNGGEILSTGSTTTIKWKASGPTNVKIEYSTNAGSSWKAIIASTANDGTYSWTVPNDPSSQCRVKVSDADDGTPADTSNSNFTIKAVSANTITIQAPNGGETLTPGSQYTIKWTSSIRFDSVDIEYYNGSTWVVIINGTPDDGNYSWTVPDVNTSLGRLWMKGWHATGNATDYSDGLFQIGSGGVAENQIVITSPNGGEILTGGTLHEITWDSNTDFSKVDIEYNNGSSWVVIVNGTVDDGNYAWTVPSVSTQSARIWIKGYDNFSNPTDYSDSTFTITQAPSGSLTVTSPNGGEVVARNSTENITWTSSGEVGNVRIYYSLDNGFNWTTITSSTTNDGIHSWTVPDTTSESCLVKISAVTNAAISDISNSAFTIGGPPEIVMDKYRLNFGYIKNGATPCIQTLFIYNGGGGDLNWTAETSASWINLDKTSGNSGEIVTVSIDPAGLNTGKYSGTITVSADNVANSPQIADVYLTVKTGAQDQLPFGEFAAPQDGTTGVSGSIAVTGWVLDDICLESVKIYREVNGGLSYIGDAVFVEGARPDVEAAYPDYPYASRAGWGYMLLTNFVPDGTLILKAIARDTTGHQVVLGTKTITVDNANAENPFGAIDAPKQGGDASGTKFRNSGWALTPIPNKISEDGSTILVFIDGKFIGNAYYKLYREDIAGYFPGYANSEGPGAYYDFDTTAYSNGVHTISWSVTDNAGNNSGIGSRYFSIMNGGSAAKSSAASHRLGRNALPLPGEPILNPGMLSIISPDQSYDRPIRLKTGYNEHTPDQVLYPEPEGVNTIEIKEMERINIRMPGYTIGYMKVKDGLRLLPVGSGMDPATGDFSWQPGPGFLGTYDFVFLGKRESGEMMKMYLRVNISPRFAKTDK